MLKNVGLEVLKPNPHVSAFADFAWSTPLLPVLHLTCSLADCEEGD